MKLFIMWKKHQISRKYNYIQIKINFRLIAQID